MTHAMDDHLGDLLKSHYEVEVEKITETWWTATVSLVTDTTTSLVATFGGFTRDKARDTAHQFIKDRPR